MAIAQRDRAAANRGSSVASACGRLVAALALGLLAPSVARADPDYGVVLGAAVVVIVGIPLVVLLLFAFGASRLSRDARANVVVAVACASLLVWVIPIGVWAHAWRSGEVTTSAIRDAARASPTGLVWVTYEYGRVLLADAQAAGWPLDEADVAYVNEPSAIVPVPPVSGPTIFGDLFRRPDGGAYFVADLPQPRLFSLEEPPSPSSSLRLVATEPLEQGADVAITGDDVLISDSHGVELRDRTLASIRHAEAVHDSEDIAASDGVVWVLHTGDRGASLVRHAATGTTQASLSPEAAALTRRADGTLVVWEHDGRVTFHDPTTLALLRPTPLVALTNCFEPWQISRLMWTLPVSVLLVLIAAELVRRARREDDSRQRAPSRQRLVSSLLLPSIALLVVHAAVLQGVL